MRGCTPSVEARVAAGRARRAREQHRTARVRREGRQLHDLVEARVRALVLEHVAAAERLGALLVSVRVRVRVRVRVAA